MLFIIFSLFIQALNRSPYRMYELLESEPRFLFLGSISFDENGFLFRFTELKKIENHVEELLAFNC